MCDLMLPPEARAAFARLAHATAHEAMTLRALRTRMEREGVTTVAQVHAIVAGMLAERVARLGSTPDTVCDAYEAASAHQQVDMALVGGQVAHA